MILSDYKLFVELIQVSIGIKDELSKMPTNKGWKVLFDMSKKQSLVGVCFAGLQRLGADADEGFARIGISEMLYLTWMGMAAKIQQRNEVVNQQCISVCKLMLAANLDFCIIKGQQVGRHYDHPLLRQSGDIDVFVKGGMKHVVDYVQSCSPTKQITHQHIQMHVYDETEVEVHYVAAETHRPLCNKRLPKWFAGQKFEANKDKYLNGLLVPSDEFNIVHSLVHSFNHMIGEGIGLRQVMDLYFLLQNCEEKRLELVSQLLKPFGLLKFTSGMMAVLKEVFQLSDGKLLCEPDLEYGRFLLEGILEAGNFGQYGESSRAPKGESDLDRFIRVTRLNFRLFKYQPIDVICEPLWRIYNYFWMKFHGVTY